MGRKGSDSLCAQQINQTVRIACFFKAPLLAQGIEPFVPTGAVTIALDHTDPESGVASKGLGTRRVPFISERHQMVAHPKVRDKVSKNLAFRGGNARHRHVEPVIGHPRPGSDSAVEFRHIGATDAFHQRIDDVEIKTGFRLGVVKHAKIVKRNCNRLRADRRRCRMDPCRAQTGQQ